MLLERPVQDTGEVKRGNSYLQVLQPVLDLGFFARTRLILSGYIFTRFCVCESGDWHDPEGADNESTALLLVVSSFLLGGFSLLRFLPEL